MSERARALEQAQIAERIAREAHAGQVDRVSGRPYIEHVERVASMVSGDEAKAVAWLHDVLEDSDVTPEALEAAGISDRVILAVRHLTRYEPRIYGPYIDRLRAGQLAAQVKVADLRDHLTPSCPESLRPRYEAALALLVDPPPSGASYQQRVREWVVDCFGPTIADDKAERCFRFLEEALELVQSVGATREQAARLVEYVYERPVGQPGQEVGGVMVTLAALVSVVGIDMHAEAERELERISAPDVREKIRQKQASKPIAVIGSPDAVLPQPSGASPQAHEDMQGVAGDVLLEVTRLEVIGEAGRLLTLRPVTVESVQFQDNDRTLKIFVKGDVATASPQAETSEDRTHLHRWHRCPSCGGMGCNSHERGGSERCWHCALCAFVECVDSEAGGHPAPVSPVEPEPPTRLAVCDVCVTAAHCSQHWRCLAECKPNDLRVKTNPCVWRITTGPLGTWVKPTCVEGSIPAPWGTERAKACHLCGAPLKVEREP